MLVNYPTVDPVKKSTVAVVVSPRVSVLELGQRVKGESLGSVCGVRVQCSKLGQR